MKKQILLPIMTLLPMIGYALDKVNGVYQIGTAGDLKAFAELVNGGQVNANAVMTADIALTEAWDTPIGIGLGNLSYTGIFDGQGHKITGFEAESAVNGGGFFGYTNNATIKNFSIDGVLTSTGGTGSGVVGYPSNSTIFNIHSTLDVIVPSAGVHHVGGVVGSARGGNTISNCTFNGTMNVTEGSTDCFGGVAGYMAGLANTPCDTMQNCANYGNITFSDVNCAAGGVVGYLNNTDSYVRSCLNIGSLVCNVPNITPKYGGAIIGRLRRYDSMKLTNNVWIEGSAIGAGKDDSGNINLTSAFCATQEQLASGEVCYFLNSDQSEINWYQTLGGDDFPVLDNSHLPVWYSNGLYSNQKPNITITVGSSGYATFCSSQPMDFSDITDIKAYIASGFNPETGTLVLTRVTEVPAGEGLYIVGTPGTYVVPSEATAMIYSNLLIGVTEATTIYPTDGDYTNFILANGKHGIGFYTITEAGELAAGKAYLQLPTASVAGVKALNIIFDDDDEDGISCPASAPSHNGEEIYNLQGQRVDKAQKGIFIVNGKKTFIK